MQHALPAPQYLGHAPEPPHGIQQLAGGGALAATPAGPAPLALLANATCAPRGGATTRFAGGGGGGSALMQVWYEKRGMRSGHVSSSSPNPSMQHALPLPQKSGQSPEPPHGNQQLGGGGGDERAAAEGGGAASFGGVNLWAIALGGGGSGGGLSRTALTHV